jgi:NAD(P)-dependent dehydrogenase (short-subunit alcohol dehydrogenase family)
MLEQTNVKGTFLALKAFTPTANPSHAAVLAVITGMVAAPAKTFPKISSYIAAKLAEEKIIEFLAADKPHIFAASVHPGLVETAIFHKSGATASALPVDKGRWLLSPRIFFFHYCIAVCLDP